jgi:surface protein
MSRKKFWAYLRNEQGQPIPSASISFRLNDTNRLAQLYTTPVSAVSDEIDQTTLTTDVSGFFQFFVGDVYETGKKIGYAPDQLFKLEWTSVDGTKSGVIDDMQIFYQIFPVDVRDQYSTLKNKLASNKQTYNWDVHRQQTWFHEIHDITQLDWSGTDKNDGTYSKIVSNSQMNYLQTRLISVQASGADSVTIESSAAIARSFDIPSGSWSPSGDLYYYDVVHNFDSQFPIVQLWCTGLSCVQYPARIIFVDDNTLRVFVPPNERDGKHLVAISDISPIYVYAEPLIDLNLQELSMTPYTVGTNIVASITASAGSLSMNANQLPLLFPAFGDTFLFTIEATGAGGDFTLPLLSDGSYDFYVDWGDGHSGDYISEWDDSNKTHQFDAGTYTIEISGSLEGWAFPNADTESAYKMRTVQRFGSDVKIGTVSYSYNNGAFLNCKDLSIETSESPLFAGTSLASTFRGCTNFNSDINTWDISGIEDMDSIFSGCSSFNQPLNSWDTSSVLYFYETFNGCSSFNQPLNSWDVSSVEEMDSVFSGCTSFNQPLNSWDVSFVYTFYSMFNGCSTFNQPLSGWDVSSAEDMMSMFSGCSSFNQPLSGWDVSFVGDMGSMFENCSTFDQPLDNWNISNVSSIQDMFNGCTSFNQPLNSWDVSNIDGIDSMFKNCSTFNQPLSGWDVSNIVYARNTFENCTSFNQPLNNWTTSALKETAYMFSGCTSFDQPLDNWYMGNAVYMSYMFNGCSTFNQSLSGWAISSSKFMTSIFDNTGLSIENYSSILIGWGNQIVQSNVDFGADGLYYNSDAIPYRNNLITTFNWTINDEGEIPINISPSASLQTLTMSTHSATLTGDIIVSGAPLPQGIIIPFYDYSVPLPTIPTGWKLLSMEGSGGTYIKGTDTDPMTYVDGDYLITNVETPEAGDHSNVFTYNYTISNGDPSAGGPDWIRGFDGDYDSEAGLHTHQLSAFGYRPEFQNVMLLQATSDNKIIPQNAGFLALDPRSIPGSRSLFTAFGSLRKLFRYKTEYKGEEGQSGTQLTSAGGDDNITHVIATSAGLHNHGTGNEIWDSVGFGDSVNTYVDSGLHWDDNVSVTFTPQMKRKVLSVWRAAAFEGIEPSGGMIAMWPSTIAPYGWELCDGNNNTPDLTDHFIELDSAYFETNDELGDDTVDLYITAGHYWGGNGLTSTPYHKHSGNVSYLNGSRKLYFHGSSSSDNFHNHVGTVSGIPFTPPHIKLVFIRKTGAKYIPPRTTSYVTNTDFLTGIDWDESYQTGGSASVSGSLITILSGEGTIDQSSNNFDGSGIYQSGLVDNFDIIFKVIKPTSISDKVSFMIYIDDENYVGIIHDTGQTSLDYLYRFNGSSGTKGGYFNVATVDEYYIRLTRDRGYVFTYASLDGETWTVFGGVSTGYVWWPLTPVDIWVSVNDNGGAQYSLQLDYIVNQGQNILVEPEVSTQSMTITQHSLADIVSTPPDDYIPAGSIILYYSPSAASVPDNWEEYRGEGFDDTYANRILKGWNGEWYDIENRLGSAEPTWTLTLTGAHTGSSTFYAYSYNLEISYATIYHGSSGEVAGNHAHNVTVTKTNPNLMNARLIRAVNYAGILPTNGIIFGDSSDVTGVSELSTNEYYPTYTPWLSAGTITPSASDPVMSVGEGGAHSHHDEGNTWGDTGYPTSYSYDNPDDMLHTHTINWTDDQPTISWDMRRKFVQAFIAVSQTVVPSSSSIIVGWDGSENSSNITDAGWQLCDGTNGTIDLRDYFICCDSTKTFGASAGDNTISLPRYTTDEVDHQHLTGSGTTIYRSSLAYHDDFVSHSHASSEQKIAAQYKYLKLAFIQKVG